MDWVTTGQRGLWNACITCTGNGQAKKLSPEQFVGGQWSQIDVQTAEYIHQ